MALHAAEYGRPDATVCRWCGQPRHRSLRGALGCIRCDWMPLWPKPQEHPLPA